jgi:membrane protease YdiL (CAAX protease family)
MVVLFFAGSFRTSLARWFFESRKRLWFLPVATLLMYSTITVLGNRWDFTRFLVLAIYFSIPVFLIHTNTVLESRAGLMDAILVLAVWLPLEFELVDINWVRVHGLPIPVGVMITVVYLLIALSGQRSFDLHCPGKTRLRDLGRVALAYMALFAFIVSLGMKIGFVLPGLNRQLVANPGALAFTFVGIFLVTALPEEFLFRGWIQNLLMTRLKVLPGLLTAAIIFGLSHLDNKVVTSAHTLDTPDWWYALFATVAGLGYGYVYQRQKSLFASALLHALVDFTWVVAFAG